MHKVLKGILALVIIGVIATIILFPKIGWFWQSPEPEVQEAQNPASGGQGQQLSVAGVVIKPKQLVEKVAVTGQIIPNEYLDLKSEISGKIDNILFDEGQFVQKGKVLVKINVDALVAQRKKLVYTQKLRETLEFRQRQLLDREAISQEEYDQALTELQTAEADINLLDTEIEKSEIRAPFNGIVGLRQVSLGTYVTPSTVLAPFYSVQPAKVEFAVPGKYSNRVKVNDPITFTVEGIEETFSGRVYAIEPRIDPNTRTLLLRARCPNPNRVLVPGQFARVELILQTKDNVLMVPTEAVIPELSGNKVFVQRNGKAMPVAVQTGIRTSTELEIPEGLQSGDTVLTSGILQIKPGMPVRVLL